jgi:hypothetical protein
MADEQAADVAPARRWFPAGHQNREHGLMVKVIEKPLHPGWVYPCTVEEIEQQLLTFPPEDLAGLAAICLVPAILKELKAWGVNGRYHRSRASICLFGCPDSFSYKFPKGWKRHHVEPDLVVERSFGMRVEQIGRRWFCRWDREDWRRFVLEHVLPHEIGHHVCGLSEELAEDYARRYLRRLNGGADALASPRKEIG